jgi:2,3,4,5-tetrahydropyridine-2-carboxylate N-succinyltransferase
MGLREQIEQLYDHPPAEYDQASRECFREFKHRLNRGEIRAAEKTPSGWQVNLWVKKGILVGFRMGRLQDVSINDQFHYFDKDTWPLKQLTLESAVRLVPGGSSIRDGCYIGRGVTCMPPMYINTGAYVGDETMIDSHALVGSCAQIGRRVHLSAGAQIGGVLEPVGALPVIIEDEVLVGGNCGIYEGTIVSERAVIGAGVILTGSTPVYDLIRGEIYRAENGKQLVIPPAAIVVPGARAITRGKGNQWGLSLQTPVIVKYRDDAMDEAIRLEGALR